MKTSQDKGRVYQGESDGCIASVASDCFPLQLVRAVCNSSLLQRISTGPPSHFLFVLHQNKSRQIQPHLIWPRTTYYIYSGPVQSIQLPSGDNHKGGIAMNPNGRSMITSSQIFAQQQGVSVRDVDVCRTKDAKQYCDDTNINWSSSVTVFPLILQNFLVWLVWFIRVYPQGPRKGTSSNQAHIVPPTRIQSDQGDPLCSQTGN